MSSIPTREGYTVASVAFSRAPYNLYSDAPRVHVTPFSANSDYPCAPVVGLGVVVVVPAWVVVVVVVEAGSVNFGVMETGRMG